MQGIIRDLHLFNIRIKIIDNAFPDNQFKADFHKMFQLDRNRCGADLILYIKNDYHRVPFTKKKMGNIRVSINILFKMKLKLCSN